MRIALKRPQIEAMAAHRRPGFVEAILAAATETDGKISIAKPDYAEITRAYLIIPAATLPRPRGLGDAVALVADPIARLSDAVLGTKLVGCGGCAQRRAALNALLPDITKPLP